MRVDLNSDNGRPKGASRARGEGSIPFARSSQAARSRACRLPATPPLRLGVPCTCPRRPARRLLSIAGQPVQRGRDGVLTVGHHVLVAQRHRRRGVPYALHQLLGGRAGGRREGRRRVPKVMEAQPVQAEVRYTEGGIARATFRVAVSGRREQEPWFFTVVVWRDQAEHAAESLSKGSRVVVMGRLQQRTWTAEDGSARQVVEVVAEELGPSLRWATARPERASRSTGD
jgi:Single-strand binding protein family